MEFYELRLYLMGNVKIIEYFDGCGDMRTVYEGDIDDLDDDSPINYLVVCSIESSNSNYVLIYVEAVEDGDSHDDMSDFCDLCDDYEAVEDEDLSNYTKLTDLEEEK